MRVFSYKSEEFSYSVPTMNPQSFHESKTENLNITSEQTTMDGKFLRNSKDLVGNSKIFRIECNKSDLRIIGNDNRIRIQHNMANIQIIGNNTRLKISNNSGNIKYTGNDGRIALGMESSQQAVDYIGCNGILKVVNAMELNSDGKCKTKPQATQAQQTDANVQQKFVINSNNINKKSDSCNCCNVSSATTKATGSTKPVITTNIPKFKSASFGGSGDCKNDEWQQLNNLLQQNKVSKKFLQYISTPNLPKIDNKYVKTNNENCKCQQNNNNNNNSSSNNNNNTSNHSFNNESNKNNNNSNSNNNSENSSNSSGIKQCGIANNINIVSSVGNVVIKNSVNVRV